ncbi:MAG: GTP cyclohydrolase II [Alphaproteobacteria bacterium]|nr:GTP cyclohydrolase II [Alphaproteobacteria bacterium]
MTEPDAVHPLSRPPHLAVERAAAELRRGLPVALEGLDAGGRSVGLLVAAVEGLSAGTLAGIEAAAGTRADLVLSAHRARTLKIAAYTGAVAVLPREARFDAAFLGRLADPATDLADPMRGPFTVRRTLDYAGAEMAIELAKHAGLLPAVMVVPMGARLAEAAVRLDLVRVGCEAVAHYDALEAAAMEPVAEAQVPLGIGLPVRLRVFRPRHGGRDHVAVIVGDLHPSGAVLTRLHSECFTGDLLGSLKCDCGPQLRAALLAMAEAGGGVLLYLPQEGRGIGLSNKLRAYHLQDQGFDTVDANERLGFADDERGFAAALALLRALGIGKVRLMTNNPRKLAALADHGIEVVERVPLILPTNPHNQAYIAVKARRSGHLIDPETEGSAE